MFAIILLVKLFTPAMKDCKVINCYRFGSGLMVASVLLVPSIFNVHEACKGASEIYSWLFVIILYTCINLGSLWSLLCTIVMINNSSYKWERGTVFGGAETVACIGKLFGILLAKYFYTAALHSSYMWPFDASMYWYALGIFLYMSGRLTYYLPKGILVSDVWCIYTGIVSVTCGCINQYRKRRESLNKRDMHCQLVVV